MQSLFLWTDHRHYVQGLVAQKLDISANQIPSQSLPRTVNIKWRAPLLVEFDITATPMSSIVHNYVGQCSIGPDALVDNNVTCGNAYPGCVNHTSRLFKDC